VRLHLNLAQSNEAHNRAIFRNIFPLLRAEFPLELLELFQVRAKALGLTLNRLLKLGLRLRIFFKFIKLLFLLTLDVCFFLDYFLGKWV